MSRPTCFLAGLLAAISFAAACDDPPKVGGASSAMAVAPVPTAAATSTVAAVTERPKPAIMPTILVDSDGPYLGGQRVKMGEVDSAERLARIIETFPINGKVVTLQADKKAKASHVAALLSALGQAGAPKVLIKTDGRKDLPQEISVTPETRITSAPGCSVVATVLKDFSTAAWPLKGGTAKKQRKGLAGPDFSHTGEELERQLGACDSTHAFFQGDDAVGWESTFNLAGTLLLSDKKKKLDALVLLREEPVAGRPVLLAKR